MASFATDNLLSNVKTFSQSSILDSLNSVKSIIAENGRLALHDQNPDDFEYYLIAFELIDSKTFETIDYFIFPVNPSSINLRKSKLHSITKTSSGVHVLENDSFNPIEISISGNFGRKLKLNPNNQIPFSINLREQGVAKVKGEIQSKKITTGYGFCKLLEKMFDKASINNEHPCMLVFYNLAFNASYVVQPLDLAFGQNESKNMIWDYQMAMKAVAPLDGILSSKELRDKTSFFASKKNQYNKNKILTESYKAQNKRLQNIIGQTVEDTLKATTGVDLNQMNTRTTIPL